MRASQVRSRRSDTWANHEAGRSEYGLCQGGQSLLEFAVVLPLMLVIAFGVTEFGRAFYQYNTLSKALRDGARYMSSHTYSTSEQSNAKNMVIYGNTSGTGSPVLPGLTSGQIAVIPEGGSTPYSELDPPEWVTVRATGYPFAPLVPSLIKLNVNFRPEVRMRYVGPNAKY